MKFVTHGPPLVGKTLLANKIASYYKVPYISKEQIVEDTIKDLVGNNNPIILIHILIIYNTSCRRRAEARLLQLEPPGGLPWQAASRERQKFV